MHGIGQKLNWTGLCTAGAAANLDLLLRQVPHSYLMGSSPLARSSIHLQSLLSSPSIQSESPLQTLINTILVATLQVPLWQVSAFVLCLEEDTPFTANNIMAQH